MKILREHLPKNAILSTTTSVWGLKLLVYEALSYYWQAMKILREHLPKNAILVGQNIGKDVEWLQLKEVCVAE